MMSSNLKQASLKRSNSSGINFETTNTNTNKPSDDHKTRKLSRMKLHKTSSVNSTSQMEHEPAALGVGNKRNHTSADVVGLLVDKSCLSSFRYKNILACRSVPILFILVCFLVIANTNCDHASSTNDVAKQQKLSQSTPETASNLNTQNDLEPSEQQAAVAVHIKSSTSAPLRSKSNPLFNVLREIYLDENSKVTMLLPDELGTVQKFHPNGRYGRRSVDNFAEQHDELAKLVSDEQSDSSRASGLPQMSNTVANVGGNSLSAMLRTMSRDLDLAKSRFNSNANHNNNNKDNSISQQLKQQLADVAAAATARPEQVVPSGANYQLEMNKLLRCNYSGVSNLYWCDASSAVAA